MIEAKWRLQINGSRSEIFRLLTAEARDLGWHGHNKADDTKPRPQGRWYEEWLGSWPVDEAEDRDDVIGTITIQTLAELHLALAIFYHNGQRRAEAYLHSLDLDVAISSDAVSAMTSLTETGIQSDAGLGRKPDHKDRIVDAAEEALGILRQAIESGK